MVPNVKPGIGLIVICTVSLVARHGPAGSFVVNTSATVPFDISKVLGE